MALYFSTRYPLFPERAVHKYLVAAAESIAIALYAISKMVAISILANCISHSTAVIWLAVECAALFAVRAYIGNWRVYISGLDGARLSIVVHIIQFICMMSAPMLLLRLPFALSPRLYASFILWTLLLSNPAMVGFGFVAGSTPGVALPTVCIGLTAAAVLVLMSSAFAVWLLNPEIRYTLYTHNTCRMHLRNYWWNNAKIVAHGGEFTKNQDIIRVTVCNYYSSCYVPRDLIDAWKTANWEAWTVNPPSFFTEEWQAGHISTEAVRKTQGITQIQSHRVAAVTHSEEQQSGLPSQTVLLAQWSKRLKDENHIFRKGTKQHAKLALEDGVIETVVNGICESSKNYVRGDFIVVGSRGGKYAMEANVFTARYDIMHPETASDPELANDGFQFFSPTGKIWAHILTDADLATYFPLRQFVGKWGGVTNIQLGDALALPFPAADEIYAISSDLFRRTYLAVTDTEQAMRQLQTEHTLSALRSQGF